MTELESDYKYCLQCSEPIASERRFCKHCGAIQTIDDDTTSSGQKWSNIKYAAIFYLFDITLCCLAKFVDAFDTITWSFVLNGLMAAVAVTFFCSNWPANKFLLNWPGFSIVKLLGYGLAAIVGSIVVHYCTHWINHTLFSKEFYYYGFYAGHAYAKILMVFSIAIMPALFEELGYRGYLLQNMLTVTDKYQAIFITSFLFAILHLSFLSLFWLIPFAMALGYVRVKENTLWYGVFMHFCFNLTVCMFEIFKYG